MICRFDNIAWRTHENVFNEDSNADKVKDFPGARSFRYDERMDYLDLDLVGYTLRVWFDSHQDEIQWSYLAMKC